MSVLMHKSIRDVIALIQKDHGVVIHDVHIKWTNVTRLGGEAENIIDSITINSEKFYV